MASCLALTIFVGAYFLFLKNDNKSSNDLAQSKNSDSDQLKQPRLSPLSIEEAMVHEKMIEQLTPFMGKYCLDCHNEEKQKGDIQLDNIDYQFKEIALSLELLSTKE